MARQAQAKADVVVRVDEITTAVGFDGSGIARTAHEFVKALTFESGTTDGTVDRVWSGTATATTTPTTIDLAGTGITSNVAGGATVTFADLQMLIVENTGTSGNILVGGGTNAVGITNGTTDSDVIPPGGFLFRHFGTAGLAVTPTTGDILQIKSSAGSVTYRVLIVGRSA